MLKIVGIILIVIGVVGLIFGGISYTTKEKVLDLGPVEATAEKEKRIPLPPILGAIALIGGVVLLVVGGKKGT
jgi:drug/metabolite transporter (DMT)-like permease